MSIHDWSQVNSGLFHDFHQSWTITIKNALNQGLLPESIIALVEQRTGTIEADILSVDSSDFSSESRTGQMLLTEPKTRIVQPSNREHYAERANRIVIQHPLGRTIAVIEIVSPGNKDSRRAWKQLIEKSQDLIDAGIHLLIIDLFRPNNFNPQGVHAAIWQDYVQVEDWTEYPTGQDFLAASYRAGKFKTPYVETFRLSDTLPDMPLFLNSSEHITVPLDRSYQETWQAVPKRLQKLLELN